MLKGSNHTAKTKKKISDKKKGKKWTPEQRANTLKARAKTQKYGSEHHLWKGGRYTKDGYVWILTDESYSSNGRGGSKKYQLEHRVVMEQHLGRKLKKSEEVHHRNGVKEDNRIENLELVTQENHFGKIRCPHCQRNFKIK